MFYNKNANDPTKWAYEPGLDRRALEDSTQKSASLRLTYQASPRNKFNLYGEEQSRLNFYMGGDSATTSPEALLANRTFPHELFSGSWNSPVTNRLLFEAGASHYYLLSYNTIPRPSVNSAMIRVTEQEGNIPGLNYRSTASTGSDISRNWTVRAAASYVTGSHTSSGRRYGGSRRGTTTCPAGSDRRSWERPPTLF